MHTQKMANIFNLSAEQRYHYFVSKIAEMEEVWGLFNKGWASSATEDNQLVIPFWPEAAFAQICCKEQWLNYSPQAIPLDDFLAKWLPGMENDRSLVSAFYSDETGENMIIIPSQLKADIEDELKKFF
jgi:hypothetical protein